LAVSRAVFPFFRGVVLEVSTSGCVKSVGTNNNFK